MTIKMSRREMLHVGCGMAAGLGASAAAGTLGSTSLLAQTRSMSDLPLGGHVSSALKEELFYREDWLGEPWRTPETAVMIHGSHETSVAWYGWVPRMAKEFRLLRIDLPGHGHSKVPAGFEWTGPNLATFVARILDKAWASESAHVIGALTGAAVGMQFAADYPQRTRTLAVSGPASRIQQTNPSKIPQWDRLGSAAPKELVDFWNKMWDATDPEGIKGVSTVLASLNLLDTVLPRIKAPTLVMTADRSTLQSVEVVRRYQQQIPNSRLLVLKGDAFHLAASNVDECVTNVLAFIKESKPGGA